jgi:HAMP domain-containing protein
VKLIIKFNLALSIVFVLGLAIAGYVSHEVLQRNAREEILQNARIMMQGALAVRGYTSSQIKPLLDTQLKYEFLPQSVSAYAATEYFGELRKQYPEYAYKEATLNPTNLRDRAADWEADIVNNFRQGNGQKEIVGDRETPSGRNLYLARPIQINDARCLSCHSTVDAAPKSMIDKYGAANGFGWNFHEVVGAQIVSVPMDLPIQRAWNTFKVFMGLLIAIGAFIFLLLNVLLITLVVRPVNKLAGLADKVSLGEMNVEEFNVRGRDEIATLAESFSRMRKSLVHALKMLES